MRTLQVSNTQSKPTDWAALQEAWARARLLGGQRVLTFRTYLLNLSCFVIPAEGSDIPMTVSRADARGGNRTASVTLRP